MAAMLEAYIARLIDGEDLSEDEARQAMSCIMAGEATDAQIGGFLVALRMKGEKVPEITGCARAMREAATHIDVGDLDGVDTCGTGGTGKGTLNVSTAAALVAAGAGVPVAKHGNRGASARWGSADVLEGLGVNIEAAPDVVERCIREAGIGFLFAPMLHKAMKYAIGPRRQLAVRTVFNILGPLTNPAGARRQVMGVFAPELVEPIASVLDNLGVVRAMVVHSEDGMDELSLCAPTTVAEVRDKQISVCTLAPEDFGLERVSRGELVVGSAKESVQAVRAVLGGGRGPHRDFVVLNAAAAICAGGRAEDLASGMALAQESIDSGHAGETLVRLVALSHGRQPAAS
jgi:anthranilate phosphoribosyltransferase